MIEESRYINVIAEQQLVEILKGLIRNPKVLILDEPSSSLTFNETETLFELIEQLKKDGVSILYITHRLTEVFQMQRISLLCVMGLLVYLVKLQDFLANDMLISSIVTGWS